MLRHTCFTLVVLLTIAMVMSCPALADDAADQAELAKKTLNPVADMISLPIRLNYDRGIGPTDDGKKYVLNIQSAGASGLGDITQSFFFSPKRATALGWILGAGPVILLPTATDYDLGGEKWGLGPTAVPLKQEHGFTYGILANY